MQTSLARRQRHRRNGTGRHAGGGGAGRGFLVALPLILFASFILAGLLGLVVAVTAYGYYSQGLPDPLEQLSSLTFAQQTVVYDSTGTVELARFGSEKREVVAYKDIPPVLIDATTSIEDKTFWTNAGFDPLAIVKAGIDTLSGNARGASTITQQLVRERLLPQDVLAGSTYDRKIKEIIQSIRLTQEFGPGQEGKQNIIAAYLNQNFYGNNSYGIKAAAESYFGISDLSKLTIAQAALLAAIPKSPTQYDLVKNAVVECTVTVAKGKTCPAAKQQLVVPPDSEVVQRRNYILNLMLTNRVLTQPGTPSEITDTEIANAEKDPAILVSQRPPNWKAPHFVWQVRNDLTKILCGDVTTNCELLDQGGYKVTTTLDWTMQKAAEKWVKAAVIGPNQTSTPAYLKRLGLADQPWIENLRGKNIHNGALIAIDYRTGKILAYVGSADYYGSGSKVFQPQFDVLADGWRQPGSAFKPINYITGIQNGTLTAASLFMDTVTDFGGGYEPTDADMLERGPVRLREALEFSLNIPAVKAAAETGPDRIFDEAKRFGIRFQASQNPAGVSIGIGTLEVHPEDLVAAYGTIANGGVLMPRQTIVSVTGSNGQQVWPAPDAPAPTGTQVVTPQASFIMTNILAGNTDPKQNPYWGKNAIFDNGQRRPATLKTGTTNDTKDLSAYGYLAPPSDPTAPAIAVGAWMGNSDNSQTNGVFSLESTAPLWQAFTSEVSAGTPIADFQQPSGIVQERIDAYSGMKPGPFASTVINEYFIDGTQPTEIDTTKVPVDIDAATGLLWQDGCVGPKETLGFLDLSGVEANMTNWTSFRDDWIARARKGPGTSGGPQKTRTAYFYENGYQPYGATWGAPFAPTDSCTPGPIVSPPPCDPLLGPCPSPGESPLPTATPALVAVPDVRCLALDGALEALTASGLVLGDVRPGNPPPDGLVTDQSPAPGTIVQAGSQVSVVLRPANKAGCG